MKYLVAGLESSCTRIVSKIIAYNLGMIQSIDDWHGHDEIENEYHYVVHRSLPHGERDNFISPEFASNFDYVILCTRDWNCSLISKFNNHHPNIQASIEEQLLGIEALKKIMENKKVIIFSYETAFLLQEYYTLPILKSLGIKNPIHINFENVNKKYLIEELWQEY